ncbi:MAG: hypothetical protein ACK5PT_04775, partial [Cereibacter sp.]
MADDIAEIRSQSDQSVRCPARPRLVKLTSAAADGLCHHNGRGTATMAAGRLVGPTGWIGTFWGLVLSCLAGMAAAQGSAPRPNVIYIVADDLG